jgi:cysteine desulfurase
MSAYFDYLSGSPLDARILDAMIPVLEGVYGNPLSAHQIGRAAAEVLSQARETVAEFIGATPDEIVFTSGGMEANNLAVKGILTAHENGQLLACAADPLSVLKSAEALERWGFSTSLIPVDGNGSLNLFSVNKLLNRFTKLISVGWVVAETGNIQPVEEVAEEAQSAGVPFHCDASVAARFFPVSVKELGADTLTLCSSFIGGPPAVGALYIKEGTRLIPQLDGGAQEMGRRSGREDLAGIVGFARALELMHDEREERFLRLKRLDAILKSRLLEIENLILHADLPSRAPGIISCRIEGIEAEALLLMLDERGVYASAGSACATVGRKASHVLKAIGLSDEQAASALNFTLSWDTEEQEIDELINVLKPAVEKLRAMSF